VIEKRELMRSDRELVKAVLGGDKRAFEELVVRYERGVRAVCMDVLKDGHLASDAAQDAFVLAYQKLGTLRDANTFGCWLVQIAKRRSLEIVRRKRIETELIPETVAAKADNDHWLDEEKQALLAAVMELGDGERETIMLRYFGDHTVAEVAQITGKSVGTITKQLSRAHGRLKNILGKTFVESGK